jgi:integrative and conjugative element protein (TIGR02256 family)
MPSPSPMLRKRDMTVWLARRALDKMRDHASALQPLETGGILLGWRSGDDRVVVDVCGPGLNALHGRHRFVPDHAWQITAIHRVFQQSKGDIDYLGDWHSHPDGVAAMSGDDCKTLRRIARRARNPLMVIVAKGTSDLDWIVGCWIGYFEGGLIRRRFATLLQQPALFDPPPEWPAVRSCSWCVSALEGGQS